MLTPWTTRQLDEAQKLMTAGRYRAALQCVLTVLSVYPQLDEALRMAASMAYRGPRPDVAEPLMLTDLHDSRLDSVFSSCQALGCTLCWISVGKFATGNIVVRNARGGRCDRCDRYYCRNHFTADGTCPQCASVLDFASPVSNGRQPMQTTRLNQQLVHVQVIREGTGRISPDYMTDLLTNTAPDVFEDDPTISGTTLRPWPDDCHGLALARLAYEHKEYLTEAYDLRVHDGRDPRGTRWVFVKVFSKTPKYVDPDYSPQ
jgi:hypothetical protein